MNKASTPTFGELLKQFREESGLTQEELAEKSEFSPHYISMIERGKRIPPMKTAKTLARAIDLTPEQDNLFFPALKKQIFSGSELREDWGEAPDTRNFYGRTQVLDTLEQWAVDDCCRLIAIVGMGGIGKTQLVTKLAERIKTKFNCVFWRSLKDAPPLKKILQECIQFISDQQQIVLSKDMNEQISLLIECLRTKRCLVVLDNVETIFQVRHYTGQYRAGFEEYSKFLLRVGEVQHQSCLLLTSREKPHGMGQLEGTGSLVRLLQLSGLAPVEGRKIL